MPKPLEKPQAIVGVRDAIPNAYVVLKRTFAVPDQWTFDLAALGAVSFDDLRDHKEVTAFMLRKLQLLHISAEPGVRTRTDVLVGLCAELIAGLDQLAKVLSTPDDVDAVYELRAALISCGTVAGTMAPGVTELE